MPDETKYAQLTATDPDMKVIYRRADLDWRDSISKTVIRQWLSQYETEHIPYAKKLLKHFRLLTTPKLIDMCKILWRERFKADVINRYIAQPNLSVNEMDRIFRRDFLPHIVFTRAQVKLGPSSGQAIEYLFQSANDLKRSQFVTGFPPDELPKKVSDSTKFIIVLDDFVGSGAQLMTFWNIALKGIKERYPNVEIWMLLCVGLSDGINHVRGNTPCHVAVVETLTQRDKVFSSSSQVFESLDLERAKEIFTAYGVRLWNAKHALGFNDSQLNISFDWHPPNNTLPVIWKDSSNWLPLKRRPHE